MTGDQLLGFAGLIGMAAAGLVIWRVGAVKRVVAVFLGGAVEPGTDPTGLAPRVIGWVGLGTAILAGGILLVGILAEVVKRGR